MTEMKRQNRSKFRTHRVSFGAAAVVTGEKRDPPAAGLRRNVDERPANLEREVDPPDMPELGPELWRDAALGRFYRPVKQAVSLRLDADVIAWLKKDGPGYQTRANRVLRERMLKDLGER